MSVVGLEKQQEEKIIIAIWSLDRLPGTLQAAQPPHESQLDNVRVKEEKLCPPVLLRSSDRIHATLTA